MPTVSIVIHLMDDFSVMFTQDEGGESIYSFAEKADGGLQVLLPAGCFPTLADAMEDAWQVFIHDMTPKMFTRAQWEDLLDHAYSAWGKNFSIILEDYRKGKLTQEGELFGEDQHREDK